MWGGGGGGGGDKPDEKGNLTVLFKQRPCSTQQVDAGNCAPAVNFERDSGVSSGWTEIPMYKPEFWEKVQQLDREGTPEDPAFHCKPAGVPRMGPPNKIVQTPTEFILLYASGNTFRVIPIDGRPHDPIKSQDTTWYGDAVGKWEGDTLVIDIVGFNDESWIGWPGWFHSNNMHVIESCTRNGQHADVAGDGRRSRHAARAVSRRAAHRSAEPESESDAHRGSAVRGARQPAHRHPRARVTHARSGKAEKWKS